MYQTYKFVRDELAEAGIIRKRVLRKNNRRKVDEAVTATGIDAAQVSVDSVAISFEYLATHTDNKREIFQHWCNSRSERFRLVANGSIPDYIKKFPILSMADGFEWLMSDFDHQFPAAKNAMPKWKEFVPKLMSYVSQKARRNPTIRDIIGAYDGSDAAQLLLSFKILPWILRNKTTKKKATTNRPNQLEVQENFIAHFNTHNDDDRKSGGFVEVKLIGSNSEYHTYVYLDSIEYLFTDVSSAIDFAFKLHYVFNLEFPKPSAHVWDFLNLAIYEINTQGKNSNFEVLSDIRRQVI